MFFLLQLWSVYKERMNTLTNTPLNERTNQPTSQQTNTTDRNTFIIIIIIRKDKFILP